MILDPEKPKSNKLLRNATDCCVTFGENMGRIISTIINIQTIDSKGGEANERNIQEADAARAF